MIVAVGAFTFVILISLGSFLAILNAQNKAITAETVEGNLRFAIEMMLKEIRSGTFYYCGATYDDFGNGSNVKDCASGGPTFSFKNNAGNLIIYRLKNASLEKYASNFTNPQCLLSMPTDDDCFLKITFSEINIENLVFYVSGSRPYVTSDSPPDTKQPKTTITIKGSMGFAQRGTLSEFYVQTTASQRKLDK